jgi:gluconolactonase
MTAIVPTDALESIASGIDHAEGICVSPDGSIHVSGEQGQIYRIDADGSATQVATTGGWTLGLAADGDGRIYACDPTHHAVLRWTPGTPTPTPWTDGGPAAPLACPNWGAFAPDGAFYVTDSGRWKARDGRVLVVRPGSGPASARTSVWTTASPDFPNGCAVSPDGRELWVLESTPGAMVAYDILPDGSAGPRRVVADLAGNVPDGLAFTTDGSVVIACYRPDVIYRWRSDLGLQVLAHDPEGTAIAAPTNIVFAGAERDIILVPNIGRWHVTRFRVPGLTGVPLFYPSRERIGD